MPSTVHSLRLTVTHCCAVRVCQTTQLTQYLLEEGYGKLGVIGCTQPRRVAAMSVAKRVSEEFGCQLGQEVGYNIRFEDVTSAATVIQYMTEGVLLRESLTSPDLDKYSTIVMDEAHERALNTDVLLGLMKKIITRRRDLHLIVTSATMDADRFSAFFGSAPIFRIPGRTFPVDVLYSKTPVEDYLDGAVKQIITVHLSFPPGDILVFMNGQEDIEACCVEVADRLEKLGGEIPPISILPLYSQLPADLQTKIFMPAPAGVRKCFPALQTRVLTDAGFLFLDEIQRRLAAGQRVLYACYAPHSREPPLKHEDAMKGRLCYCEGELFLPPECEWPKTLIEVSSCNEQRRWAQGSGAHGTTLPDSRSDEDEEDEEDEGSCDEEEADEKGATLPARRRQLHRRSRHVSLLVTPDHDMYVQMGNAIAKTDRCGHRFSPKQVCPGRAKGKHKPPAKVVPPGKVEASQLLSPPHDRASVRLLACASSGYTPSPQVADRAERAVRAALRLTSKAQFDVFLELFGFWLGDGSMQYASSGGRDAVVFAQVKETDIKWLDATLPRVGLRGEDVRRSVTRLQRRDKLPKRIVYWRVINRAWFDFFDAEFGIKYNGSRFYDRVAAVAKQGNAARATAPSVASQSPASRQRVIGESPASGTRSLQSASVGRSRASSSSSSVNSSGMQDGQDEACQVCSSTEFTKRRHSPMSMLLCDGEDCHRGVHLHCAGLTTQPKHDWFCQWCRADKSISFYCPGRCRSPFLAESKAEAAQALACFSGADVPACYRAEPMEEDDEPVAVTIHEMDVAVDDSDEIKVDDRGNLVPPPIKQEPPVDDDPPDGDEPLDPDSPDSPTKSAKWLPQWVVLHLPPRELRLLLYGLYRTDGSFKADNQRIYTSGVGFRDQLMQALLHCGYTAYSALMYAAGVVRAYHWHDQSVDKTLYTLEEYEAFTVAERANYVPVTTTVDSWVVTWSEPVLPGKAPCWPLVRRQTGITEVPYSKAAHGVIWCVKVVHNDHLIIAQRAHRDPLTAVVTKQSRPIIVGQCIISTNLAETSITVDGIRYVIDIGYSKLKVYNPKIGMDSLSVTPIARANADQRAGRAGRTGPGVCFRLYTEVQYNNEMLANAIPEIQRTNLSHVVLLIKSLGVDNMLQFDFLDPPPQETILSSMYQLWVLGALDNTGQLTALGRRMVEFPLDPPLSKMLLSAEQLGCVAEMVVVVAMLSIPNVFFRPADRAVESDAAREKFFVAESDHLTLLHVFQQWKVAGYSSEWCRRHYLHVKALKKVREVQSQLHDILATLNVSLSSSNDFDLLRRCIASAFFHQSAHLKGIDTYVNLRTQLPCHLHPSSALASAGYVSEYVVYNELVLTSKEYMRTVTVVEAEWLAEYGSMWFSVRESYKSRMERKAKEKVEKAGMVREMEEKEQREAEGREREEERRRMDVMSRRKKDVLEVGESESREARRKKRPKLIGL